MKNDTTFVRKASGDHLGDAKVSKRGTSLSRIYLFSRLARPLQHQRTLFNWGDANSQ